MIQLVCPFQGCNYIGSVSSQRYKLCKIWFYFYSSNASLFLELMSSKRTPWRSTAGKSRPQPPEDSKKKARPHQEGPPLKVPGNVAFARMVKEQFYVLGVDNKAEQKITTRFLRKYVPPMWRWSTGCMPTWGEILLSLTKQLRRPSSSNWSLWLGPEEEKQYNYPKISYPSLTAEDAYAARPWLSSGIPDYENYDVKTHSPVSKTAEKWVETYKRKDDE